MGSEMCIRDSLCQGRFSHKRSLGRAHRITTAAIAAAAVAATVTAAAVAAAAAAAARKGGGGRDTW